MFGTVKLDLKPLPALPVFCRILLILTLIVVLLIETGLVGVCSGDSAVVPASCLSFQLLVSQCHGICSFVHTGLLFVEESPAHCFCCCVRSCGAGVSVGWIHLNECGDSCIECFLIVSNHTHCSAHVCLLFIECINLACESRELMGHIQIDTFSLCSGDFLG